MHVGYFTERPHRYVSNDEIIKNGFFGLPNRCSNGAAARS